MTVNDTVPTEPDPYVPTGPLEQPPSGYRAAECRPAAMAHVLRGVQLGAYDERIIAWIVQWDDSTIRTIASLIERARGAACAEHICLEAAQVDTVLDALDEAGEGRHARADRECGDCDTSPDGLCDDHSGDLERASRYDAIARQLRQEAGR